ncbi:MAG: hypothetical protein NC548_16000 [Lachnospiraceae bacterium]|nr:hypothetical protein [Lachnospiraceae bacterium]
MNKRIKKKIQKRLEKSKNKSEQEVINQSQLWWWLHTPSSSVAITTVNPYGIHDYGIYPQSIYCFPNSYPLERRNKMEVEIYKAKWTGEDLIAVHVGYLKLVKFDRDECWHLCNWSCWTKEKPNHLYTKITSCSTDVIFYDQDTKRFHIPMGIGWEEADTLEDAVNIWKTNPILIPYCKAIYEYLKAENKSFEELYCYDGYDKIKYNDKDIIWCHWDLVRFLNEDHVKDNVIGVSDNRKTTTGRDALVDFRIYLFKSDDKFEVDIFTTDADKDNFKFNTFDKARDFADSIPYKHPEYSERPSRLIIDGRVCPKKRKNKNE